VDGWAASAAGAARTPRTASALALTPAIGCACSVADQPCTGLSAQPQDPCPPEFHGGDRRGDPPPHVDASRLLTTGDSTRARGLRTRRSTPRTSRSTVAVDVRRRLRVLASSDPPVHGPSNHRATPRQAVFTRGSGRGGRCTLQPRPKKRRAPFSRAQYWGTASEPSCGNRPLGGGAITARANERHRARSYAWRMIERRTRESAAPPRGVWWIQGSKTVEPAVLRFSRSLCACAAFCRG